MTSPIGRPTENAGIGTAMSRYFPATAAAWLRHADRTSPWARARVVVGGIGITGYAAATGLLGLGARVTVLTDDEPTGAAADRARIIQTLGGTVLAGTRPDGRPATAELPAGTDLVVISPGFKPTSALTRACLAAPVPVFTDLDLARRLEDPDHRPAWLCLTGSNGKTTTTGMLGSILTAAGLRAATVGNIGASPVDAVLDPAGPAVLAVEASAQQLHYSPGLSPHVAAMLNLAPDHFDFHGDLAGYRADKQRIFAGTRIACVYNIDDPSTEAMVAAALAADGAVTGHPVTDSPATDGRAAAGCRAVGFTLGVPAPGQLGVVDGVLAEGANGTGRHPDPQELGVVADLPSQAPHVVANALAAAAMARAYGVAPAAVAAGLAGFRLDRHRIEAVGTVAGVDYVNDSKATNPHAAQASLQAYDPVVWIAGGQAKGLDFDELVSRIAGRLRAVVLLGRDRAVIAAALARHAPQVPVIEVSGRDTRAMVDVVAAAAGFAQAGDTVLLAPGCASHDMFSGYPARGDAFVAAVLDRAGPAGPAHEHPANP